MAVFLGRRRADSDSYTLRIGHFATVEDAYEWTADTNAPLPQAGSPATTRVQAARLNHKRTVGSGARLPDQPGTPAPTVQDRHRSR